MPTPKSGYVYLLGSTKFSWVKIGCAINPKIRVKDIGVLLPFRIELFAVWKVVNRFEAERAMHIQHADKAINGEWFYLKLKEIEHLIAKPQPFIGELMFDYWERSGDLANFSNIQKDATAKDFKKFIDPEKKEKFWAEVAAVYEEFKMEPNSKNRLIAIGIVENRRKILRRSCYYSSHKGTTEKVAP